MNFYTQIAKRHAYDIDWGDTRVIVIGLETKRLNRFYGLAKIHKPVLCIRPIISNSGTVLQGLSKWLDFKLRKYLKTTSTFLQDSDQLLRELPDVDLQPNDTLITFDVVSLYTNIPITQALLIFAKILARDRWKVAILQGLELILRSNYFEFGDLRWLQLTGTAMGTPVAPTFASLYLGFIEDTKIKPLFQKELVYFKSDRTEVAFLDLRIMRMNGNITTATHQKALNLYLYLPAASAHPPGMLKGLIIGLVKKYKRQNSSPADFAAVYQLLHRRLRDRGYAHETLLPLFKLALESSSAPNQTQRQVLFKVMYDPNGPSRATLRHLLKFDELNAHAKAIHVDRFTICYLKPPTLKTKLCPTSLNLDHAPTPASRLAQHRSLGTDAGGKP
ncbi:hypothetical protein JM18_009194 [Phytophthora kernoviae]|uniref:Reverse transcriptase domain-containing protein n=1 Tax=Phytophthora kernoviae TaxID=325452 RepID=A0A921V3J1_9STRA|nr:hypothetical protein JM18_009194 [Phytophthora kernoviae]